MTRSVPVWRNWGRTVRVRPAGYAHPTSVDEVAAVVRAAAASGLPVKAVGAGHSFSAIAEAPGVLVNLDGIAGVVGVDVESRTVTVGAGTRLRAVPALVAPWGWAMENLGDIDTQSVAGAISTGTHGTGARFGGIATQVAGVTVVDARGEVVRIDEQHSPELLPAVALGLGAFGIVVEVTLRCVEAFDLCAVERPESLGAVLESLAERAASADHFEFFWFPHTSTALTKVNSRVSAGVGRAPLPPVRRWVDDVVLANGVFGVTCAVGRAVPACVPWVNRAAERLTGNRTFSDASDRVFVTRRSVRFTEMEYAIPAERVADAFGEVQQLIRREGWRISFPVEVRFAAADELWLSTAFGRDTAYIAVHRVVGEDPWPYFGAVEQIMRAHGGRPHWGKMHGLEADDLATVYPRFADFCALRHSWDPQGVFLNPYLRRVLSGA